MLATDLLLWGVSNPGDIWTTLNDAIHANSYSSVTLQYQGDGIFVPTKLGGYFGP